MKSANNFTLQVVIVGSGPSGFYVAEALINSSISTEITILERLPCPYGLVRYGVAPDHQKLKSISQTLDAIAEHPSVTFLGNLEVGKDIQISELMELYHVVVFTTGMPRSSLLGINGENLTGVHPSSTIVGWYNGHPDYQTQSFDFGHDTAIIIGHGNVAIDICRVLTKSIDELRKSDIPDSALEVLSENKIKNVHLIGRRGPVQAKFTTKELHELGKLENCNVSINPKFLKFGTACQQELDEISNQLARKNHVVFQTYSNNFMGINDADKKQIAIDFMLKPEAFKGDKKLQSILLEECHLEGTAFKQISVLANRFLEITCGLAFTSVGFKAAKFDGLFNDSPKETLSNVNSRLVNDHGDIIYGMYAAGWVKRGPNGVIGTNRECAQDTVDRILEDLAIFADHSASGRNGLMGILKVRNIQFVTFNDWKIIDAIEIEKGQKLGKPREKFTSVNSMLACI